MFFVETAMAQAAPAGEAPKPSMMEQMFPLIFMFVVLWFFMIRPQSKRARLQEDFLTKIKVGDNVITNSGMLGKIQGLTEKFVTLEISEGVRIKILKTQVAGPFGGELK